MTSSVSLSGLACVLNRPGMCSTSKQPSCSRNGISDTSSPSLLFSFHTGGSRHKCDGNYPDGSLVVDPLPSWPSLVISLLPSEISLRRSRPVHDKGYKVRSDSVASYPVKDDTVVCDGREGQWSISQHGLPLSCRTLDTNSGRLPEPELGFCPSSIHDQQEDRLSSLDDYRQLSFCRDPCESMIGSSSYVGLPCFSVC